ncbi:hypothetical protein [Polyangium sorediatum]|uniref:Lipoprotein n=1 Tax=Polyangium sorediatum TaxID=889274 RepID=A0ABT6P3R2_9BACT|nr:hypothetical protein [Polyangium sorediatum]MDI1434987.1 hypothetical protein [Polyangium sorediatum]
MKRSFTVVAVAALGFASCAPPTAITVDVYTEVDCASDAEVSLTVAPDLASLAARAPSSTTRGCVAPGRAGNVVIAPADDREKPLAFAIATRVDEGSIEECLTSPLPAGCIVARRQLRFSPNQELPMRVDLRLACQGIECPSEQTCVKGACVAAEVEPSRCVGGCDEGTLPPLSCGPAETHLIGTVEGTSSMQLVDTPSGPVAAWRIVQPDKSSTIHLQQLTVGGAPKSSPAAPISAGQADNYFFLLGYDGSSQVLVYQDVLTMMFQKVDLQGDVLAGPISPTSMYRQQLREMPWNGTRFAFWVSSVSAIEFSVATMDPSGVLGPAHVISQATALGNVAWNGTSFGASWRGADGNCYVTLVSADGTSSEPEKLVAPSCSSPHLSGHPQGWNYVYEVGGRIEYVQLDGQGDTTMPPVVVSPQSMSMFQVPRSVSLTTGKTWVIFAEELNQYREMYAALLEGGDVVRPAARWPGDALVLGGNDYAIAARADRVHIAYVGYPTGMTSDAYSTVLCDGSAP